jgi:hypothetical protein
MVGQLGRRVNGRMAGAEGRCGRAGAANPVLSLASATVVMLGTATRTANFTAL